MGLENEQGNRAGPVGFVNIVMFVRFSCACSSIAKIGLQGEMG